MELVYSAALYLYTVVCIPFLLFFVHRVRTSTVLAVCMVLYVPASAFLLAEKVLYLCVVAQMRSRSRSERGLVAFSCFVLPEDSFIFGARATRIGSCTVHTYSIQILTKDD